MLVFYYHALELLFAFGYRPGLARTMETYRGVSSPASRTTRAGGSGIGGACNGRFRGDGGWVLRFHGIGASPSTMRRMRSNRTGIVGTPRALTISGAQPRQILRPDRAHARISALLSDGGAAT